MSSEKPAKNEKAAKICGYRGPGTPIYFPWELGFSCPICMKPVPKEFNKIFDENGDIDELYWDRLAFSEYNGFMFCKWCNIDIPSYMCLQRPIKREELEKHIHWYLEMIEEFQARATPDVHKLEYALVKSERDDLKKQVERLKNRLENKGSFVAKIVRLNHKHFWTKECPNCEGQGLITEHFELLTCPVCDNKGHIPKWRSCPT